MREAVALSETFSDADNRVDGSYDVGERALHLSKITDADDETTVVTAREGSREIASSGCPAQQRPAEAIDDTDHRVER